MDPKHNLLLRAPELHRKKDICRFYNSGKKKTYTSIHWVAEHGG